MTMASSSSVDMVKIGALNRTAMDQANVCFSPAFSRAARSRLTVARSFNQITSLATFPSLARCLLLFKCDQSSPTPTSAPNTGFAFFGSGGGGGRAFIFHNQTSVVVGNTFTLAFRADLLIVARRCWTSSSERVRTVCDFSTSPMLLRICGSTTVLRYLKVNTSTRNVSFEAGVAYMHTHAPHGTNGIFGKRRDRRWLMHDTAFVL
jgi:hypothetical protein